MPIIITCFIKISNTTYNWNRKTNILNIFVELKLSFGVYAFVWRKQQLTHIPSKLGLV